MRGPRIVSLRLLQMLCRCTSPQIARITRTLVAALVEHGAGLGAELVLGGSFLAGVGRHHHNAVRTAAGQSANKPQRTRGSAAFRALPSEGKGHTFESCRVRQYFQGFAEI